MKGTVDLLEELTSLCRCGVHVTVNGNRDMYETVEEALNDLDTDESPPEIAPEVRAEILSTDTLVDIVVFPDTPIGSYRIIHYDLREAIVQAIARVEASR